MGVTRKLEGTDQDHLHFISGRPVRRRRDQSDGRARRPHKEGHVLPQDQFGASLRHSFLRMTIETAQSADVAQTSLKAYFLHFVVLEQRFVYCREVLFSDNTQQSGRDHSCGFCAVETAISSS